jgi:very-short-patch-repair endonuclease/DNA polymerase III delta prime subunit
MYKDLDPDNWADDYYKVAQILRYKDTTDKSDSTDFGEDYDIDNDQRAINVPLILDADSSQQSAIIDVLSNKDLVIEGPPGTGKSQTISNLIAAALYENKSVLFLAEKKAALEVVKKRLDNVGLGDFCLELHSHKTQKAKLHAGLKRRLEKKYEEVVLRQSYLEDLKKERDNLQKYVDLVNSQIEPFGATIYDILWAVERYTAEFKQTIFLEFKNALSFTQKHIEERVALLNELTMLHSELPSETINTWTGFYPTYIFPGDELKVKNILLQLAQVTDIFNQYLTAKIEKYKLPISNNFGTLNDLVSKKVSLPPPPEDFDQSICNKIIYLQTSSKTSPIKNYENNIKLIKELDGLHEKYQFHKKTSQEVISPEFSGLTKKVEELLIVTEKFAEIYYENISIEELGERISLIDETLQDINKLNQLLENDRIKNISIEKIDNINKIKSIISLLNLIDASPRDIDINAHPPLTAAFALDIFQQLQEESLKIKKSIEKYSSRFDIVNLPQYSDLRKLADEMQDYSGKLLAFLSSNYRKTKKRIKSFLVNKGDVKSEFILNHMKQLSDILESAANFKHNDEYCKVLGPLFKGIETYWNRLETHVYWSQNLATLTKSQEIAKTIISNIISYRDLSNNVKQRLQDILEKLKVDCEAQGIILSEDDSLDKLQNELINNKNILQESIDLLRKSVLNQRTTISALKGAIKSLLASYEIENELKNDNQFKILLGNDVGVETDLSSYKAIASWSESIYLDKQIPFNLFYWALENETRQRVKIINDCISNAIKYFDTLSDCCNNLKSLGSFEFDSFISSPFQKCSPDMVLQKVNRCFDHLNYLILWSDYCRNVDRGNSLGLEEIIKAVEMKQVSPDACVGYYLASIYRSIAKEIIRKYPELALFTRASYENSRKRFVELDKMIISLRASHIAGKVADKSIPDGRGWGLVKDYTDKALIIREINKRKRHIPIRQLVKRAGSALLAMKPCFMMSPLSVAQYLPPGQMKFDLAIMDEASQIRPEDAIGAVARCSQVVVVGDPKQLPPTTFFDRINEDIEEDESVALESTESILDACLSIFKTRRLIWHYRSEHESLIAFSNRQFYDDSLIVFPSPSISNTNLGVKSHYISGAKYLKGRNLIEAQRIVDAVVNHFRDNKDLSLGVATFNIEQRDLIIDLLDKRQKDHPWLERDLKENEESREPLFIKNLENVQGDERDVIFISATYGPDPETNKVYQRFGPVLGATGWRRLNVIFTRAKKRVELFTSMKPSDLILTENTARGVRELRTYLEYAEKGGFPDYGYVSPREPESDFEISVARVVDSLGFKAIPQVGVAGFFIDIGVLHPDQANEFILGIECDGATYHSTKSVRDRDRLRQEILERKGWTIHRIWSADWFKNREKEIQRLSTAIREIYDKQQKFYAQEISSEYPHDFETKVESDIEEDLETKLLIYRQNKIEPEFPDQSRGILRKEMINAFVFHKPTTMDEFRSKISLKLRETTDRHQIKFLEEIFEIIEDYL